MATNPTVQLALPEKLHAWLETKAGKTGLKLQAVIRQILATEMEREG